MACSSKDLVPPDKLLTFSRTCTSAAAAVAHTLPPARPLRSPILEKVFRRGEPYCMDRFSVVLARPAGAGNVGSVSRLCKNFGCPRLRLVSPGFDFQASLREGLTSEMGWYSRHQGLEFLEQNTEVEGEMADAVAGCTRVVGFSRRRGRHRSGLPQVRSPGTGQRARELMVPLPAS